ncbi:hypothetical protein N7449_000060 [Penicillium cf. viridicatum]|uniref:Uncharacterized protein n=1 Tax=Penicillium cf. viridicatum TaxID=2972119 RepID=A0A9W9N474_9EURO|nr:hypothetical protein N7449_000060 [Penicillium cf. viridicatum]
MGEIKRLKEIDGLGNIVYQCCAVERVIILNTLGKGEPKAVPPNEGLEKAATSISSPQDLFLVLLSRPLCQSIVKSTSSVTRRPVN